MALNCEFCGVSRPSVYCNADIASLCIPCDARVHSANTLSKRHERLPLCETCGIQPALVRCLDHTLFMCQNCDRRAHDSLARHRRQPISCFMGCPSARDLATLWGYDLKDVGYSVQRNWANITSFGSAQINKEIYGETQLRTNLSTSTYKLDSSQSGYKGGSQVEAGLSNRSNKILQKTQRQVENNIILTQILDLEKLQLSEIKHPSSVRGQQVNREAYSTGGQILKQQCEHHQGTLAVDTHDGNVQHQELLTPLHFFLPLSLPDNLIPLTNEEIPLHGEIFWSSKGFTQNTQLWPQNMQDLGFCQDVDFYDSIQVPEIDLKFPNYEELFAADQDNTASLCEGVDEACSSSGKAASLAKKDVRCTRSVEDIPEVPSNLVSRKSNQEGDVGSSPLVESHPVLSNGIHHGNQQRRRTPKWR
ncbi:putative zinc finger protein At1g68190 [Aristolochia californica]|uniref:putative zinc finger protein At1g68190 n=1 Tax=Aristolochia californica TaxID=171875 RepID=UPI0035E119A8